MSDDDIKDKQDIKDEKRVKVDAEHHDKQVDDRVQFARRKTYAPGLKGTSSNASTDTPDSVDQGETREEKESKKIYQTLKMLDDISREMDALRDEMDKILDKIHKLNKLIKDANSALRNNDMGAMNAILIQQGFTPEQVDLMTPEEKHDHIEDIVTEWKYERDDLQRDYDQKMDEYQAKQNQLDELRNDFDQKIEEFKQAQARGSLEDVGGYVNISEEELQQLMDMTPAERETLIEEKISGLKETYKQQMEELGTKAEKNGLDLTDARETYRKSNGIDETSNNALLKDHYETDSDALLLDKIETVSDNTSDIFASMARSTSVAKQVEPDGKAEKSIMDLFNKAATSLGIEPKTPTTDITPEQNISAPGLG